MKHRRFAITAGLGCAILTILMIVVIPATFLFSPRNEGPAERDRISLLNIFSPFRQNGLEAQVQTLPDSNLSPGEMPGSSPDHMANLYESLNPGVVNITGFGSQQSSTSFTSGSGMVFKDGGYILTSSRLVVDAAYLTVTFFDGSEAESTIIGQDPVSDLAVLKVEALPEGVHPLTLADSDQVSVGEWVFVLSNPSGLSSRMNTGIVSAVGPASIEDGEMLPIPNLLQIDQISSGEHLGGPLMNYQGSVVGITTQIPFEGVQPGQETGHAVPSNLIDRVAAALIEQGSYSWPWIGVKGFSVNIPIMRANQLETPQGVYIQEVTPGSPAETAGLRAATGTKTMQGTKVSVGGDVVVDVDGKPVEDIGDFLRAVSAKSPGEEIKLTIIRNGNRQEVSVKLSKTPEG